TLLHFAVCAKGVDAVADGLHRNSNTRATTKTRGIQAVNCAITRNERSTTKSRIHDHISLDVAINQNLPDTAASAFVILAAFFAFASVWAAHQSTYNAQSGLNLFTRATQCKDEIPNFERMIITPLCGC